MLRLVAALAAGRAWAACRRIAATVAGFIVALLFAVLGLAALMVAGVIALTPHVGAAGAAAIMGGGSLLVALVLVAVSSRQGGQGAPQHALPPAAHAAVSQASGIGNELANLTKAMPDTPQGRLNLLLGAVIVGLVLGRRV